MAYNNRNLLLTDLEAGSPRSRCQQGRVLLGALFWVADDCLPAVPSMKKAERGSTFSQDCPRGTSPIPKGPTLMPSSSPNHLSRAPPPHAITLGEFQQTHSGGTQPSVYNSCISLCSTSSNTHQLLFLAPLGVSREEGGGRRVRSHCGWTVPSQGQMSKC